MRKIISHTIVTLDGVAVFDAVSDTIVELRDTEEVLGDFYGKLPAEDAMLLGRVTYQEWAEYWPTSTTEPFASHINTVPKYVISRSLEATPWGTSNSASLISGDFAEAVTEARGTLIPERARISFGIYTQLPIRDGRSQSLSGQGMSARWRGFRVRGVDV